MAEHQPPLLNARERGAALLLVIIALAAIMPLAILLSDLSWRRLRQVNGWRQDVAGQAAVRGGLEIARARLQSGGIVLLGPGQSGAFALGEAEGRPVRVRVSRQEDAVLDVEGRLLPADAAAGAHLGELGFDGLGNVVSRYRRLEVYLVEAESTAPHPFGAVRLLAAVVRLDTGQAYCVGLRYDRGYFRES